VWATPKEFPSEIPLDSKHSQNPSLNTTQFKCKTTVNRDIICYKSLEAELGYSLKLDKRVNIFSLKYNW